MAERYTFKNFNVTNMAVGPKAKIVKAGDQTLGDLPILAAELERLKQALIQEASSTADYQAVAEIQAAKESAAHGRRSYYRSPPRERRSVGLRCCCTHRN